MALADDHGAGLKRRGLMLILSSPSGAGKTSLTRMLLQKPELDLTLSISVTTRPRRSSEVEGIHYRFIPRKRFEQLRDEGELLEWAEVHGNFYGTPREPVERTLAQGRDVLFDIDYQGTQQVKAKAPGVVIFLPEQIQTPLRPKIFFAGQAFQLGIQAFDALGQQFGRMQIFCCEFKHVSIPSK